MDIRSWLKRFFGGSALFDPSFFAADVPPVVIRELREDDLDACYRIYSENAPGHFPEGYFKHFENDLASDGYLWLVIEEAGVPIGVGGISIHGDDEAVAALSFGMIRPDRHGMGYGSALLLARVAALPQPDPLMRIFMSSVEGSVGFYKKFGFAFVKRFQMDENTELDWYYVQIKPPAWEASRILLASARVEFDPDSVKVPTKRLEDTE